MRRKILLYLFICILGINVFAAQEKKCDFEYLFKNINYTYNKDGSYVKHYHHKVKLHTFKAVNRIAGETFIPFNKKYQKLEIIKSLTRMKDGTIVKSPANAFNEVLLRRAKTFPALNSLREMVVTHTGLERGAVIELEYKLYTRSDFADYFTVKEMCAEFYPVRELNISFRSELPLKGLFIINNRVEKKYDSDKISINLKNIAPVIPQKGFKKEENFIIVSGLNDPAEILPVLKGEINKEIEKEVCRINKNSVSTGEMLSAIMKLVNSELQTAHTDLMQTSYNIRDINSILKSSWADITEKNLLYAALCKRSGIDADIICVPIADSVSGFLSHLAYRNIYVRYKGFYVDVINNRIATENTLNSEGFYSLAHNKILSGKNRCPEDSVVSISGSINLNSKENSTVKVRIMGGFYNWSASVKRDRRFIAKTLKNLLNFIKIREINVTEKSSSGITASVKLCSDLKYRGNKSALTLSTLPLLKKEYFIAEASDKEFEGIFPLIFKLRLNILYKGMKKIFAAKERGFKNEIAECRVQINSSKESIEILRYLKVKRKPVKPGDYKDLREVVIPLFNRNPLLVISKQ